MKRTVGSTVPDAVRSKIMSAVRQRGTGPEIAVRACLRRIGYRYSCNVRRLPGSPDLVIPSLSVAIFVHGCFWHRHRCPYATIPRSNADFWSRKFQANKERDRRFRRELRRAGWNVIVVWGCWTRDATSLDRRLKAALSKVLLRRGKAAAV